MGANTPQALQRVTFSALSVSPPPPISGTTGVWEDVTPAAMATNLGDPNYGNTDDNFGVQDVFADPVSPNVMYAYVCYQGVWRSTDWGQTWSKRSTSPVMDTGKLWAGDIAPDGSYMLACIGNSSFGSPEGKRQVWRSTDGGRTWTGNGQDFGVDPYCVRISPFDKTRVILTNHDDAKFHESLDSGATFTQMLASVGSLGASNYCSYLHNSDTALFIPQSGGTVGCYRLTKSGTWSASAITDLSAASHEHGFSEPLRDPATGNFYFGSADGLGIWRSTNNGANWTQVGLSGLPSGVFGATPTNFWAARSFPDHSGAPAKLSLSLRSSGTSWSAPVDFPGGMANGPKRMAVASDGLRTAVVFGCWNNGLWRYIE